MIKEDKMLATFRRWLLCHGSRLLEPQAKAEAIRFTTREGVGSIYRSANGAISKMTNGAEDAWHAFRTGRSWNAQKPSARKRRKHSRRHAMMRVLALRDGWHCVYCGVLLTEGSATLEHIVPLVAGGTEHLNNLTLACRQCNSAVGSMAGRQKIEFALLHRASASPDARERRGLAGRKSLPGWFRAFFRK